MPTVPTRAAVPTLLALALASCGDTAPDDAPEPPAPVEVELLAPGTVSSEAEEYRIAFTPDGLTAYFGRGDAFFPATRQAWIYETRWEDGAWTEPEVASFSGRYSDIDPFVSPDGSRLFFSSIRPVDGEAREDADLWMVVRTDDGWGEPIHLGPGVNSPGDELYPSVDAAGNLFVGSSRPVGEEEGPTFGIWRFQRIGDEYAPGERLESAVNGDDPTVWNFNPAISPDGRRLVFTRLHFADQAANGFGEIMESVRVDGAWTPARNVGSPVNTALDEFHPSFSPDGETFYFVRRNPSDPEAKGSIHTVPARALEDGGR